MIKAKMVWDVDPVVKAMRISSGIKNKALRIALNAGAAPVKAAVISSAPKDEGHLAASTKIKVRNYKNSNCWVAVVGAGSKYKRARKFINRKTGKSQIKKRVGKDGKKSTMYIRPAAYQHLVDQGTKKMTGRRYLSAAFNAAFSQFKTIATAKLRQVIEGELLKNRG